ncbi:hypothetical protein [Pseudonocardia parietis]|uniref:Uncharacterized protein n=1 Tax=Pseudonocardia parietis TaxID=570936 RepID=A0ABS4W2A8_9PSEU|nr:hypothetical protein [Pseudonocardia parietis]MBP2370311.1 hypothetical protein [Pseudonocardia parietis]
MTAGTPAVESLLPLTLQAERHGEVAVPRLCRAAERNALNDATVLGVETFFTHPPDGVRAVVLDAEQGQALGLSHYRVGPGAGREKAQERMRAFLAGRGGRVQR